MPRSLPPHRIHTERGIVKNMDAAKKYCYIGSKGNPDVYYSMNRGDDRENIEDLEDGNLVEFVRDVSAPSRATSVRIVHSGRGWYRAKVKGISHNCAFLFCESINQFYGQDVFVGQAKMQGLAKGDAVSFELKLSDDCRPQAIDVRF